MKITELFKIVEGETTFFRTSGDADIDYLGDTYIAEAIGRSEVESKNELSRANLELSMNIDNPIAQRYMNTVVDSVVSLTVFTQTDTTMVVSWKGRLASVKPDTSTVKLIFESIFTSLRRPGLRRRYQRNCSHVLYGRGCKLDKEDFAIDGTASAVAGATVTVAAAASASDGWFTGGMLKAPDGTLRFIISHVGNQIGLIRPIDSLTQAIIDDGPQAVRLYRGCDRTRGTCDTFFDNLLNNGSFPFIPTRNPFNGSSFA